MDDFKPRVEKVETVEDKKVSSKKPKKSRNIHLKVNRKTATIIGSVAIVVVVFLLGAMYGTHQQKEADKRSGSGRLAAAAQDRWTAVGTITEVSESKIKVKDVRGEEKEADVTSDTTIVDSKSQKIAAKDLKKDQKVIVTGTKDGKKLKATRIRVQA